MASLTLQDLVSAAPSASTKKNVKLQFAEYKSLETTQFSIDEVFNWCPPTLSIFYPDECCYEDYKKS